jgi:predicted ATPase
MFNEIKLTNFKCFQGEVAFPLSKINLLTGINGRGKSSFIVFYYEGDTPQNQYHAFHLDNENEVPKDIIAIKN